MSDITVVIPCRNERVRLGACLDALEAQDFPARKTEIIVVDGDSRDGSGAIALARGVTRLTDPGRGPAAARNLGVRHASGDIIAFTDADCVPRFDWLARLSAAFEADPAVAGVAGALRLPRTSLIGRLEDNDARMHYRGYITSNIAYRKDVLEAVGGFDESLSCAEDYDLAWRVLDAGHSIARCEEALVLHDPPEIGARVPSYLRKQLWYARHDVPAHMRAIARVWRTHGEARGSSAAIDGLGDALRNSAYALGAAAALGMRSPPLLGGAVAAAAATSARHVAGAAAQVGSRRGELARMSALETAKRFARGVGTLLGFADLARPSVARSLKGAEPSAWLAAPRPARPTA